MTKKQEEDAIKKSLMYFKEVKIILTDKEKNNIEIVDFGLNRLNEIGLQLVTYVNTERVCAKELVLFPGQICPEHMHPDINGKPGKEETFRCRYGRVNLYVPGQSSEKPLSKFPNDKKKFFTVWNEIILNPGDQYTLEENTFHWFQGGPNGAVISEFSTRSVDEADIWTDPEIRRIPEV